MLCTCASASAKPEIPCFVGIRIWAHEISSLEKRRGSRAYNNKVREIEVRRRKKRRTNASGIVSILKVEDRNRG